MATTRQKKQNTFVAAPQQGLDWAKENQKPAIITGVVALVLMIVLLAGYGVYEHRTTAAQTAFGEAFQVYQTPVANPEQPTPPGAKTFPDEKTRAAAANTKFVAVANQYGSTEPGKLAEYFAGLTYLEQGQYGSAETSLKKVAGSWNGDVAASAKMALAQLYQQTGRDQDAIPLYNDLSKGSAATVPANLAQLQLAALYESEGKSAEAKKIYAELKDKDKTNGQPGPAGELAAQKLAGK